MPCYGPCPAGTKQFGECCCSGYTTPIVIDTDGSGFQLTSPEKGVEFRFFPDQKPIQMAWTTAASKNAWLVLDRDHDGDVDTGAELFGNVTPQPAPPIGQARNGFLALAVFDKPENGGNGDGVIDSRDAIFSSLKLWIDENHDGKSSPSELHSLPSLGIAGIDLNYVLSSKTDEFGNKFRFKAAIIKTDGSHDGRWAYDVVLGVQIRPWLY